MCGAGRIGIFGLHIDHRNMKSVKGPTESTLKKLFALSRNRCAFPQCVTAIVQPSLTMTGKVCHIRARSVGGPRYDRTQTEEERHGFANLILLCSVHHDIVDAEPDKYNAELLQEMKELHERDGDIELSQDGGRLARRLIESYYRIEASGNARVMVGSPGGIQAEHLTIKTDRRKIPTPLPTESIGASVEMRAYVEYLIKRYIEFRLGGIKSGKDRRSFHPSMFHQLIEREFGARANLVPQTRFADLAAFIQNAIDDTIIGRNRKAYGERSYHSFEDHLERLRGKRRASGQAEGD
jgi:hypothetical protein